MYKLKETPRDDLNSCLRRLRRAVLHPSLAQVKESSAPERAKDSHGDVEVGTLIPRHTDVTNGPEDGPSSAFAESVLSRIQDADGQECAVCFDLMDLPVLVPNCMHSWWAHRRASCIQLFNAPTAVKAARSLFYKHAKRKAKRATVPSAGVVP
jgi:hypothetical protein